MKKIRTILTSFVAVVLGLFALASCDGGKYDLYEDWSKAGAAIEKDNIYEVITKEQAVEKINAKETFILVASTSEVSACRYELPYLDVTAKELGWKGTVYFINVKDDIKVASKRAEYNSELHINDINAPNQNSKYQFRELCLVVYKEGQVFLDTTNLNDTVVNEFYKLDSFVQSPYEAISAYLFKDSGLKYTCLQSK